MQVKDDDESVVLSSDEEDSSSVIEADSDSSDENTSTESTDDETTDDTTNTDSDETDSEDDETDDDDSNEVEIVIGYFGEEGYLDENGIFKAFVTFEDYDLTIYKYLNEEENAEVGVWFDTIDTNGDTILSFEEFDAAL